MLSRFLAVVLTVSFGLLAGHLHADEPVKADETMPAVKKRIHVKSGTPQSDLFDKKLFVIVEGSAALADTFRKGLESKGYKITLNEGEADGRIRFGGGYGISGRGLETVTGKLAALEQLQNLATPANTDYTKNSVGLDHVALSALATGVGSSTSVTDLGIWITQKIGVAGWFNKMVTGDPRGFCMHENCNKFDQRVLITADGDGVEVTASALSYATSEKIVVDRLFGNAVLDILNTFPSRKP